MAYPAVATSVDVGWRTNVTMVDGTERMERIEGRCSGERSLLEDVVVVGIVAVEPLGVSTSGELFGDGKEAATVISLINLLSSLATQRISPTPNQRTLSPPKSRGPLSYEPFYGVR
jgi:hypothetical protein